jgi:NADH:ubiquinone oxidoreductase subunit 4 (subunit M)
MDKNFLFYILVFGLLIMTAVLVVHAVQGERTAILPIKVFERGLTTEYPCWILPMEGYSVRLPVFDDEVDPLHEWWNVKSARCSGLARVGR